MEVQPAFQALGLSLALGLLMGLQMERRQTPLGGMRTFAMLCGLGAASGILGQSLGPWIVGLVMLAVSALLVVANISINRGQARELGIVAELAALVTFMMGACAAQGWHTVAIALGIGLAGLLEARPWLHEVSHRIGEQDVRAVLVFGAVTFIILPVLPDRAFGPYGVANPYTIWLMVVLVVGMSLSGYIAYKMLGQRRGMILGGVLGGLISSTATTVSYARRSRNGTSPDAAAFVITVAGAMVYPRLMVEVAVAAPSFFDAAVWPLAAMFVTSLIMASVMWLRATHSNGDGMAHANPTELKSAVVFAIVFAIVLVANAAAKTNFGDRGAYAVAAVSGLTDMDAITLSTAKLVDAGRATADTGWRSIIVASLANNVFKAIVVASLGSRALSIRIALVFLVKIAVGVSLLLWWHAG